MANILIKTGIVDERITSCKIYRSATPVNLYNTSNLIGTVTGASIGSFTDTVVRDQSVLYYYYGFECVSAQGNSVKSPPHAVQNVFDAPAFFGPDYGSIFNTGGTAHGLIMEDVAGVAIPLRSEIMTWFSAKVIPLSSFLNLLPSGGSNYAAFYNGECFIIGSAFAQFNTTASTPAAELMRIKDLVAENPDLYTITRNGFKWQLDLMTEEELSSTGVWVRGSNAKNSGIINDPNSFSYLMGNTVREKSTLIAIQNTVSKLKPNNFFDFDVIAEGANVNGNYIALTLRYVGQA